jgi:hypothetical protein
MMNVLDALRYRLSGQDLGEPSLDPRFRQQQQPLPPGLPLVVQDSIRNLPAYQEGGQVMAPEPYYAPNMGEEVYPREDPRRRDYQLQDLLGFGRFLRNEGGPAVPEGDFLTVLPPGQSPFATPEGPSPGLDYLPGGATRISAGQGLLRGGQPTPQAMPSPEVLAARQRAWQAQQPQGYPEGQVIPGPRNPLMEQEAAAGAFAGPQRERTLMLDLAEALGLSDPYGDPWKDPRARAMPEGGMWSSRPADASPYASPLNQMLQRPPFGQY